MIIKIKINLKKKWEIVYIRKYKKAIKFSPRPHKASLNIFEVSLNFAKKNICAKFANLCFHKNYELNLPAPTTTASNSWSITWYALEMAFALGFELLLPTVKCKFLELETNESVLSWRKVERKKGLITLANSQLSDIRYLAKKFQIKIS